MFDCSHTIIGGFLQDFSNPGNGLPNIEYQLKKIAYKENNQFIEVNYYQWLIEAKDYARRCIKYGIDKDSKSLCKYHLIGYSFGGQTVVDMLWEFHALQIPVQRVLLIDPVRRDSRYPWGYFSALNRRAYFTIPSNVDEVLVIRQKEDMLIRGHPAIKSEGSKTFISNKILKVKHGVMDNTQYVRSAAMHQARQLHAMPTPVKPDDMSPSDNI